MCGIVGLMGTGVRHDTMMSLKLMTDAIAHRGPDGEGQWCSDDAQVGLGHRRLSIIDLSTSANQPMHILGRYSIVFNGEIYNFLELKSDITRKGYTFKTDSDTEVLLAAYALYGSNCLQLLDGMFAFIIYDKEENTVFIARDRFGEKPLFYTALPNGNIAFASEIKALFAAGAINQLSNQMLFNYVAFQSLEDPQNNATTFYEGILRFPHASYTILKLQEHAKVDQLHIVKYYEIDWQNQNTTLDEDYVIEKTQALFKESVSRRLRSDVPVGSSLSGGLDSSIVVDTVASMVPQGQLQHSFSAVFPGFAKDESKFIDIMNAQTGMQAHKVTPAAHNIVDNLDEVFYHQEEPFASASIFVQYMVMQLAQQHGVTVLLDGQGADEVFAGYHHYYNSYFNELKRSNPQEHQRQWQAYVTLHESNSINGITKQTATSLFKQYFQKHLFLGKKAMLQWKQLRNPLLSKDFFGSYASSLQQPIETGATSLSQSLYMATTTLGLQQLLRYADRNSMANQREVRLPFLSHNLVDFAFSLPNEYKINKGWTKYILRRSFTSLPNEIAWRKDKIGYEPPQEAWLSDTRTKDFMVDKMSILQKNGIVATKALESVKLGKMANADVWKLLMASYASHFSATM